MGCLLVCQLVMWQIVGLKSLELTLSLLLKQVDDIKTNIDTFYELVDSTDPLTGDQEVQLKQVRIKLDNYFNTSRRFSIEG